MGYSLEETILNYLIPPIIADVQSNKFHKHMTLNKEDLHNFVEEFKLVKEKNKNNLDTFVSWSTNSKDNFIEFVDYVKTCWSNYLDLIYYMNILSQSLHTFYPSKLKLIRDLIYTTYKLNQNLYLITSVEKEIYEHFISEVEPERLITLLNSVRSFPVYLGEKFADISDLLKNEFYLKDLIKINKCAKDLFYKSSCSFKLFGNTLKDAGELKTTPFVKQFEPKSLFEEKLKEILVFDHFIELCLRKSGILSLDLDFYSQLYSGELFIHQGKKRGFRIGTIISTLTELIEKQNFKFKYKIKKYYQTDLSCGVACFINALTAFDPSFIPSKKIEMELLHKVTVLGYFNNLPSSLVKVARQEYGIPAKFIVDISSFAPLYINNKENENFPPAKKFLEDYSKIPHENMQSLTKEEALKRLKDGSLIAYVCGEGEMLHYKLIYGYELVDGTTFFEVFDPQAGTFRFNEADIDSETRNSKSFWGVEYTAQESVIFDSIKTYLEKAKQCLEWKNTNFINTI